MSEVASLDVQVFPDEKSVRLQRLEHMLRDADQDFLYQSQAMIRLLEEVAQMAETDMTMLVMGETGVGKGVLAERIHNLSRRQGQPFVALNCGSLPAGLIESELFGHERGAFTGAVKRHIGCFERANYGTLFLDEIGDLPLEAQRALLRILENYYLTRVGGEQSIPVDVRVIAATNKDLKEAIRGGDVPGRPVLSLERVAGEAAAAAGASRGYPDLGGAFCASVCPKPATTGASFGRRSSEAFAGVRVAGECARVGASDSEGSGAVPRGGYSDGGCAAGF